MLLPLLFIGVGLLLLARQSAPTPPSNDTPEAKKFRAMARKARAIGRHDLAARYEAEANRKRA